jgi:osmoprotectant transport system permease protein
MDSNLMYAAIGNGVDVICPYTTDGRIAQKKLVILKDPKNAFPPYDAMLLVSARAYKDDRCRNALMSLVGAIDENLMGKANLQVDVHGKSPREAAGVILQAISKKQDAHLPVP